MQQTPKIALFFATSGTSGVDRLVSNLLPEFADTHYTYHLLQIGGHGPRYLAEHPNIRHVRIPANHKNTAVLPLAAYLWKNRPTHILSDHHRLNMTVLRACRMARASTRIHLRIGTSLSALSEQQPKRFKKLSREIARHYPRANALITPSEGVTQDLRGLIGTPNVSIETIPNPIVNKSLYVQAKAPVDHPWFIPGSPPLVVACGSLSPNKDFATLISAFSTARTHIGNAHLVILGEGPERGRLLGLAKALGVEEHLWMPGFVENPYKYISKGRIFAHTSRREGLGAVIVEALALGVPVVATDCPTGPADTLQGGRLGELVQPGDAESFAQALIRSYNTPMDSDALKAGASRFAAHTSANSYLKAMGIAGHQ
ncbi:glycosyltransferase [Ectothiorhodospira variabilis]|uniref:glycosyltransferase n=1 Tax=Ectothiorhodospira variabilis TaxID=505694 RepID=UPI001EFA3F9E|nr:glycosyltransferase [Ectothiorhodospira variabilis]MCG5493459.1 glycosyltransferase [Ectothiorhodospira variabilis]MCG5496805.1 glycosyltransferase [Ectothiorhodospira variabilis]MCG5502788.1 glycosyltransferase [Ectothiorhodospira variabilis]MCG5506424.1 glycosyltransferase [Ectothiorhodospira variabilis]